MLRRFFCLGVVCVLMVACAGRVALAQSFTEQVLYSFCSQANCSDGEVPSQGLIQAADGNFYGTTSEGGSTVGTLCPSGCGTIFKVTPQGALTTLYTFTCTVVNSVTTCPNGFDPVASLVQGIDGNFYGTTYGGGAYNHGTVFKITPSGKFTSLYSFCSAGGDCPDGSEPEQPLVQGTDGNFYGVTLVDGASGIALAGTAFKITPSGTFTTLHSFCSVGGNECTDGAVPNAVVQGADGNFYGTTREGGRNTGDGTVFKMTADGTVTTLYYFCQGGNNCTDGEYPVAALVQAVDGNFYGSTLEGGPNYQGVFYRVTPSGGLTAFDSPILQTFNQLILGSTGNLYGTYNSYLSYLFQVTLAGAYSPLDVTYIGELGEPVGIVQGSDGNLYGDTAALIFKLAASPALPAPVQVSLSEASIALGQPVTIQWQALNTFSATMQQCAAFVGNNATGAGAWTGVQPGTLSNGVFSGSTTITPTVAGIYSYALTCGGVETGFSTGLQVGGAKAATSLLLNLTSPLIVGSALATLGATVTSPQNLGPVTGTVTFSYGGTVIGTLDMTNGTASLNLEAAGIPIGTYPIAVTYSGSAEYASSSATANLVVVGNATSVLMSIEPATVTQGQSVVLTAEVLRTASNETPTGTVKFSYGSTVLGTATLSNQTAQITVPTSTSIPPGSYVITAQYSGDALNAPSSATASLAVEAATTTTLSIAPSTISSGQSATLTATVKRVGSTGTPTGTVTFSGSVVGTATLVNGTATFTVTDNGSLPVGTDSYTATYSGDAYDTASNSTTQSLNVGAPGNATQMDVTVSPTSASLGQLMTVTAKVTRVSASGTPAGTVKFTYNSTSIGSAPLVNGTATLSFSIPTNTTPNDYVIGAVYPGDAADQTCSGSVEIYVEDIFATTTTLTASPNPVAVDSALTMTAKVKTAGTSIPTGTVSFMVGTYVAGTATLDTTGTGTANLTDLGIPAATYPVTAVYSGNTADATSSSAVVNVVVQ